ncbi:hypothetical protein GN156_04090 [bacterium LRH843]|nr:hypothetical protein [bacterium LRH843]
MTTKQVASREELEEMFPSFGITVCMIFDYDDSLYQAHNSLRNQLGVMSLVVTSAFIDRKESDKWLAERMVRIKAEYEAAQQYVRERLG